MQVNSVYRPYHESQARFRVLFGGAGSGKSYAIAQNKVLKLISAPHQKEIVLRKNYVSLKDSCYALLRSVIESEGLGSDFIFRVSPLEIIHKSTGNRFLFRGLKDAADREKIKSIVDPSGAWFEEANEFDPEDITQVALRLRGSEFKGVRQIDISFNPVDEEHWLKGKFFDNPNPDQLIFTLRTTYRDNTRFLPPDYIRDLEALINEDENLYNIYTLGLWGSVDTRGRIYKNFDDANLCDYAYNPQLPIIVCCDFNVDPMKWALVQCLNGIDYVFDEVVQADTDTESQCQALLSKYGKTQYIFYGDYSGTFRHTSSRSTDYDIIKQYFPGAMIKTKPNPAVINRINAVNWRLCNKQGEHRLMVSRNCKNLIADFRKVKYKEGTREEDKQQEKYDGKNPVNALVHISSAVGYYIEYNYSLKGTATIQHKFY